MYSIAGDATLLAKPVIGTRLPAPPQFASFGYIPSPVKRALKNTSIIVVYEEASSIDKPPVISRFVTSCPSVHIQPPIIKAFRQLSRQSAFLVTVLTYSL